MNRITNKYIILATLLATDILSVALAFLTAYFLRDKGIFRLFLDSIQPITVYLKVLPEAVFLLVFVFSLGGLYEPKQRITKITELYASTKAITLWILFIMAASYLSKIDYSRLIVLQMYILTLCFVSIGRMLTRKLHMYFFRSGFGNINILILGTGKPARKLSERIEKYRLAGYHLVGFIGRKITNRKYVIGTIKNLYALLDQYDISEVYIADTKLSQEKILTLVANCPNHTVTFKIASNMFELITGNIDILNLEAIPSLNLSKLRMSVWQKAYKRLSDVLLASCGLIATLPLLIVIVVLIKIDSKGKAIFRQKRIGLYGKPFLMYKFRTMTHNTARTKQKEKEKVTRIGRILRKTSLDELPQLINILKGDMSIVGPRPEIPEKVAKYSEWEKRRLTVKPGLTGLWQVLGRKDLPLSDNIEYDFYYINNQSIVLDIIIILKTIPQVLQGKGAY